MPEKAQAAGPSLIQSRFNRYRSKSWSALMVKLIAAKCSSGDIEISPPPGQNPPWQSVPNSFWEKSTSLVLRPVDGSSKFNPIS